MADSSDAQARLASLRRRWEADRASRVFLQLAEEYRRLGHLTEAVEVIEGGLRHHPSYLSAHVALARCRVELGDFELAEPTLRKVLAQDPTQMVAMKLLVQSYLGQGRTADAADWLARYELLAVNDDDIALLRARVSARSGAVARAPEQVGEQAVATEAVAGSRDEAEAVSVYLASVSAPPAAAEGPSTPSLPRRDGLLFELPALAGPPLDLAGLSRPGRPRLPLHYTSGLPEPFPYLYSDLPRRLGEGELFRAPAVTATPAAEEAAPSPAPEQASPAPAPAVPLLAVAAPEPPLSSASAPLEMPELAAPVPDAEAMVAADTVASTVPEREQAVAASDDAVGYVELPSALPPRASESEISLPSSVAFAEASGESAAPAESASLPVSVETAEPRPALEAPGALPAPAAPGASEWLSGEAGAPAAPAVADTPSATVTLADLHSQQGYLDDAEDLYRQVLAREPWNTRAAAGLRQVALRRPPPLDALSLLRGFRSSGGGLTAKKTHVLRSYLEQLRRRG